MFNLGVLLKDSDPPAARGWYERAADAGHAGAMFNLGLLLKDRDLSGQAGAPNNVSEQIERDDPEIAS